MLENKVKNNDFLQDALGLKNIKWIICRRACSLALNSFANNPKNGIKPRKNNIPRKTTNEINKVFRKRNQESL